MLKINNYFTYKYNQFDNRKNNNYNGLNYSVPVFQSYKGCSVKDLKFKENIIKKMASFKNIDNSPVAYIKPILNKYLNNQITTEEFCSFINKESDFAKYCLSKMTNEDIKQIQQIFQKEFLFADKLNSVVLDFNNKKISNEDILKKISEI